MTNSLCSTPLSSFYSPSKPVKLTLKLQVDSHHGCASTNSDTNTNSLVCANCDGNGAIQCTQCEGKGVNSKDHFDGQYKAGGLC
ncbi:protein BUNDLE SHEATH DEFECTIVE 2, chloroplastic-like [Rutidosis leptorrhynchoides]|uniref:protein BUNDLE SHEATH DEFECTIVE 2, chloroplastic-like n=1 Tax=Rutidosis leptorrhynchoides TaxID=125765 RepID=UPI003A998387